MSFLFKEASHELCALELKVVKLTQSDKTASVTHISSKARFERKVFDSSLHFESNFKSSVSLPDNSLAMCFSSYKFPVQIS